MSPNDRRDEFVDDLAARLGLDDVTAALADLTAETPPPPLRNELLANIARRPRQPIDAMPTPGLYAARVRAMSDLLDTLDEPDWAAPAAAYPWTVHELVAHLTVIEEYTLRQLGLTELPPLPAGAPGATGHLDLGADVVTDLLRGDPAATVHRWRTAATRIVDHVQSPRFDPAAPTPLHAWPFDASTALVVRAFEIWTHADDIRRATGRPLDVPAPAELRTMSSTSVRGLPALLAVTGGPPMRATRVVLTGPGGGTFDLLGAPDETATDQLLVADVVAYCRVVARRVGVGELAGHREGDDEFLDALLRAASAIAI